MSSKFLTPEFKEDVVRQITERGYSVAVVSARLGVSAHVLYNGWVLLNSARQINRSTSCLLLKAKFLD